MDVRFDGDNRSVSLTEGEAAFDIAHDPAHPFIVAAGDHQVEVLGTAFNVLNHGDRFAVAVERGVVAVTPVNAPKVRLVAGQALAQSGEQAPAPVSGFAGPDFALATRRSRLSQPTDD